MNRSTLLAIALGATAGPAIPAAVAADLTVVLHGVRAQTGVLKLALVDSQAGWDGQARPVQATGAPPSGDRATFVFKDLAPGSYAVLVTHDENGNGALDSNLIGMPLEGYGFSNNPQVMRKPRWDEARVDVREDLSLDITLR